MEMTLKQTKNKQTIYLSIDCHPIFTIHHGTVHIKWWNFHQFPLIISRHIEYCSSRCKSMIGQSDILLKRVSVQCMLDLEDIKNSNNPQTIWNGMLTLVNTTKLCIHIRGRYVHQKKEKKCLLINISLKFVHRKKEKKVCFNQYKSQIYYLQIQGNLGFRKIS